MTLHVRCTSNSRQRSIIVKRQATMRSSPPLNIFKPLVLNQVRGIQELLWPAQIGLPVLAFWALHINGRSRSMRHVHNENVVFHLGIEERPMHRDLTCVGCPVLGQTWPIPRAICDNGKFPSTGRAAEKNHLFFREILEIVACSIRNPGSNCCRHSKSPAFLQPRETAWLVVWTQQKQLSNW